MGFYPDRSTFINKAIDLLIKTHKNKVIKFNDLKELSKLFNVKLTMDEKREFYGRKSSKIPIIRRKDGVFLSSYSKYQTNLYNY